MSREKVYKPAIELIYGTAKSRINKILISCEWIDINGIRYIGVRSFCINLMY